MLSRNRILLVALSLLLVAVTLVWFTPFMVTRGLRLWISWKAHQEHLVVKVDKIEAPLFRPVVFRGIHVSSAPESAVTVQLEAAQATFDLNLKAVILRRGRSLRALTVEEFRAETHRYRPGAFLSKSGWNTMQKLFPLKFNFPRFNLRMEDGSTIILVRNGSISGSEVQGGEFTAGEIAVTSPWIRQTFGQLRGGTKWQDNRLTLAGISLARGLDLQWITIDLSQVRNQRVAIDFDVDAFGGKIRASVANEWLPNASLWNVVGSAGDISLARTSEAFGFTDRLGGLVHACKFTFRGDPHDPMQAAASLWTELTGLSWRDRAAEVIMLGASLYNRQIDIQQLYVRQKQNQLTMNGQAAFPSKSSDWLSPDFQGNISASINQLGDFAALFGANPGDFAGKIAVEGTMNARERKIGGHLNFEGKSLTLFKTGINTLNAKLNLIGNELQLEQLELKRKNDSLTGEGKIDMSHEHAYSGRLNATVDNFGEYLSILYGPSDNGSRPTPAKVEIVVDGGKWDMKGTLSLPDSSPLNFTAAFALPVGTTWDSFRTTPVNATFDFPSIFLGAAPQFFHPAIFSDGIVSGKLSVSETVQHPRITGDVQLLNGKLQNTSLNLTQASSRITFEGNQAAVNFFNAATKDVDLSFRGDIDLRDTGAIGIKIVPATPLFDQMPRLIECVSKIDIEPVQTTLAPAATEIDIQGGLFKADWAINLVERTSAPAGASANETSRKLPLCFGKASDNATLTLGTPPRAETAKPSTKKRKKRP